MRIAALVIGIFGSIAAFIGALLAMFVGGVGAALGDGESEEVILLGLGALVMSVVGLVGAALSVAKPRAAAALMATSAIVGVILVFVAYIFATVLLLIAALLAFLGRKSASAK